METTIYTKINNQLIKEWQNLWNSSSNSNYANSPSWFLSVTETFKSLNYKIIVIRQNKKIVAIAPLFTMKMYGISMYSTPPQDFTYEVPFLINPLSESVYKILVSNLTNLGNIFLENIPDEFILAIKLHTNNIKSVHCDLNYYLELNKDSEGRVQILNRKKVMHQSKKFGDKLILKTHEGYDQKALETVFKIDDKSRKQSRGYSAFSDKNIRKFYTALAKNFNEHFLINILYFDDTPIAYRIGFVIGKTYYGSQVAFLKEYGNLSPGNVLFVKFMESSNVNQVTKIDFGSGDSFFKRRFASDKRELNYVVFSKNIFVRYFISLTFYYRNEIFEILNKNPYIYSLYRHLKAKISEIL